MRKSQFWEAYEESVNMFQPHASQVCSIFIAMLHKHAANSVDKCYEC
jgi:hypothetical protein